MEQIRILGVKIDNITMSQAVDTVSEWMDSDDHRMVVTPNPEIVYHAYLHPEFKQVLNQADLTLPDGIGVVYGAKIIGTPLQERVPGFDFCCHTLEKMAATGKRLFLLGGKPGVAEMAVENIKKSYPGIGIAGYCDGYFKDDEKVLEQINQSNADFLMVCLGFPRQENWIAKYRDRLSVKVSIGAGGSVDVLAGTVKRAPALFCRFGLEWFYRLLRQPSRIGRMMNLPKFLLTVMKKTRKGEEIDG